MPHARTLFLLVTTLTLSACWWRTPALRPERFDDNVALYQAALARFEREDWDQAVRGFEHLTLTLAARDTLLPLSHYYLGRAHFAQDEFLLAAQTFSRLTESFPLHPLADDALLAAAQAYARMWKKPSLDPTYGEIALSTFQTLQALYPESPLLGEAQTGVARLREWMAIKDYRTGVHYLRRKAYDPAIIYFQDVVERFPDTPTALAAYLRLVQAYRAIEYQAEVRETCAALQGAFPDDRQAQAACAGVPAPAATEPPVT